MDELLRRFPDVAQNIFKQLDDKSLANCREVNKIWCNFLDNKSFFWRRRIQKYSKNQTQFQDAWRIVTKKVSIEKLRELAIAIEKFYKIYPREIDEQQSPLQIGAAVGNISICENIAHLENKNPADNEGLTPLHFAASNGHMNIVKYIAEHLEDKNPSTNDGWTPLHSAAYDGHLEIFKCIAEHLDDKNPATNDGWTPLHSAAQEGHLEVVKYIAEHLGDNNPVAQNGSTPKSLALRKKHFRVVSYLESTSKTFQGCFVSYLESTSYKRPHVENADDSSREEKRRKL